MDEHLFNCVVVTGLKGALVRLFGTRLSRGPVRIYRLKGFELILAGKGFRKRFWIGPWITYKDMRATVNTVNKSN